MPPTFDQPTTVAGRSDIKALVVELRIRNELLVRVVSLLSQLNGPLLPVNGGTWLPEELSADLDAMRNDPAFGG